MDGDEITEPGDGRPALTSRMPSPVGASATLALALGLQAAARQGDLDGGALLLGRALSRQGVTPRQVPRMLVALGRSRALLPILERLATRLLAAGHRDMAYAVAATSLDLIARDPEAAEDLARRLAG